MKYLIRLLLLPCIFLWLTACAILPKRGTQPKPETQPMMAGVETSRRRIASSEDQAATGEGKGARRRPLILTDIEEVPEAKEKKAEAPRKAGAEGIAKQGSISIFEPYDPEKARQEALREGGETLPKEIREELLGVTEEEYVTLNFEQAPIAQILNAVSETLGMNFIMSPGAKGTITMQTSKPVPASELFQILQSVLEVNGLTLVPSGRYFKLVAGKEAKQYPIKVVSGKEGEQLPPEDTFITQIIPLDYIPVKDMQNILQPFLSKSAPPVITHEDLNILIINDFASNIKRLLKFVQELDKPLYQPKEKVYVYYVENGDADKLASTLSSIYKDQDKSKWSPFSPLTGEKQQQPPTQPEPQQIVQTPFGPMVAPEQVSGEVRITADKEINALIIVTSPRNYPSVLETIKKLDIMPKQALIEALIVDVTLTDRTEFGLGWYLKGHEQSLGANMAQVDLSTSVGPESFSDIFGYKLITDSRHFVAFMKQLNEITNLNVMSSPYIMALDNQKATINITRQYPVPREREITSVTGIPQIERTYDYKEVGLKLDVTPKINESNLLTLEIKQEVSEFAEEYKDTGQGIYNKREATSKVVISDGQTIVIGGLIQNKVSKSKTGIPFFSDIPVVGKLFGGTRDVVEKTELLIFMTPHVVTTQEEVEKLTTDFEVKVESLKKMLEEFREGEKQRDQAKGE
ncbi:MAG: secretin N-terminal domain-containing protein [bacterium]